MMEKKELNQIFNMLKTISSNINGYTTSFFKKDVLVDENAPVENKVVQQEQNHSLKKEELISKINKCTRCPLARTRNSVFFGYGVSNPTVLVITDYIQSEDFEQKKFVSKQGVLLEKMLASINLSKENNCFITSLIKCVSPDSNINDEEMSSCVSFLFAQIQILKPKMILCFGKNSLNKLLNNNESITNLRGNFFEYSNIPVMTTFSPDELLQNDKLKALTWQDLKLFKSKIDEDK